MKRTLVSLVVFVLIPSALILTDDKKNGRLTTPSREELEKQFQEKFNNVTLAGHFRLTQGDKLGPEQEELYNVQSVTKLLGNRWNFNGVRIKYGGKDVTLPFPIPVDVVWAGDTPVISVTDLNIPGVGTYTARVMVYRDIYTGAWFASDHGGSMAGSISKNAAK